MSFDYIRVDDILIIHADQIKRYGGGEGIRDPGLLESALFRPQTGHYPTLIDEAAALFLLTTGHLLTQARRPLGLINHQYLRLLQFDKAPYSGLMALQIQTSRFTMIKDEIS